MSLEAGLSLGGVYRYFRSKESLILAIAQGVGEQLAAAQAASNADPPRSLGEEVSRLIAIFDGIESDADRRRVAIAVWSESLYNDAIRDVVANVLEVVVDSLARRMAVLQSRRGRSRPRCPTAPPLA